MLVLLRENSQCITDQQANRSWWAVLYTVDKGLRGWNILQSVAIDWLIDSATYVYAHQDLFTSCHKVAMSLYNIITDQHYQTATLALCANSTHNFSYSKSCICTYIEAWIGACNQYGRPTGKSVKVRNLNRDSTLDVSDRIISCRQTSLLHEIHPRQLAWWT